jgi:hypothetical protein
LEKQSLLFGPLETDPETIGAWIPGCAAAQGLLTLVSSGLGPLGGAALCSWLRHHLVTADGHGWMDFFPATLSAMIAIYFIVVAVFYRGLGKRPTIS